MNSFKCCLTVRSSLAVHGGLEKVREVTDNIYLVKGKGGGRFPYSFSILILDEVKVLIDTGCGVDVLRKLRKKYDVDLVINSHTHPDHSAGNWLFKGKPIYVPEEGFPTSGDLKALSERFTEPGWLAEYWIGFVTKVMGIKNCRPTESYNEKTVFKFGDTVLLPIHTPGHTRDHYCFYEPNERILFSFDYDLTSFGPWYGHRESSIEETRRSIERIKSLRPRIVVSGHRGVVVGDLEAEFDAFQMKIDERSERILRLLGRGRSIEQLVDAAPIYGGFPYAEPLLRYWEKVMIEKHLEELERKGKVKREGEVYFRVET